MEVRSLETAERLALEASAQQSLALPSDRLRQTNRRQFPPAKTTRPVLLDLWDLTKPEITFLVTLSTLAGFLLGSPATVDGWLLLYALFGTGLSSAGGAVLNHYLERDHDGNMRRTASRPLPSGRIAAPVALGFGIVLSITGVVALFVLVNPLTAFLAALTICLYLFAYTPLKRRTHYNTLIGTIPGALPALGGWTAATGSLALGGWLLFAILVLWQMPHFLSLAWMYRKDYARAGYKMLPVIEPDGRSTVQQTLFFTAALVLVSLILPLVGVTGWVYGAGAVLLGIRFLIPAYAFFRSRSTPDAKRVLMGSILYIPLLVVLIFIDRIV